MEPATASDATVEASAQLSATTVPFAMVIAAAAGGVLLFAIGWASPVVAPLGLGLFLAALAAPLFGWLEGRGLSSPVALTVTIGLVLIIGGAMVLLALVSAQSLSDSLARYTTDLESRHADLTGSLGSTGVLATLGELVSPATLVSALRSIIDILVQVGGSAAFAIMVAALLLLDGRRLARLQSGEAGQGNPVFREAAQPGPGGRDLLHRPNPDQCRDRRGPARPDARAGGG